MPLILDELSYARTLLKTKKYGNYLKLRDAVILAKYYRYYENKDTRQIKKTLISICRKLDKNWNKVTQGWKIDASIKESKKRRIRTAIPIPISFAELEKIKEVNDYALEKVLFVFLVYAKFLKYANTLIKPRRKLRLLGSFYVNERLNNILSVARVEVKKKKREEMIHRLYDLGYIDATRYNGFILKYIVEDSPTMFFIEDYENIVLYYQREKGEQVVGCSCGRLFLKKTSRSGLCHICKQEKRRDEWRLQKYKINSTIRKGE